MLDTLRFTGLGGHVSHVDKCPRCNGRVIINTSDPDATLQRVMDEPGDPISDGDAEQLEGGTVQSQAKHGSATDQWNRLVSEKIAAGMSRDRAVMAVNRENPGLRERYVAEANASPPPRR
jgi:hypothetical protein